MKFQEKLNNIIQKNNSLLCVGLDPINDSIFEFNKKIIDETHDLVCAYKPDIAFYEAQGIEGLKSLKKTLNYIPKDIPIILDAKRGSVGHTAQLYAKSIFGYWNADAVTLNIFTGKDGVDPFLKYKDQYSFLYLRSSNPSASDFQDINVDGKPLFQVMAEKVALWKEGNFGIIAPATYPKELKILRKIFKDRYFLVPGIGVQGGDLEKALIAGLTKDKSGLIISVSRGIIFSENPRKEALKLKEEINKYRYEQ